jgi:hypothetical protein
VNGITAEELMDCLETAGSRHDEAVLDRLWASVPERMRLPRLSAGTVPALYRGGFAGGNPSGTVIDVSGLPGSMRREMTWCVFRVIDLGGRIQVQGTAMLARRLAEITAAAGAAGPSSLTDLTARAWLQQIPLAVHRRRGKLPAPSSLTQMRQVLLRFLWLLDLAYDTRPWWQRESWHPVEDPRVPVRLHEPEGRQALHFHRITAGWLRRAAQWHGKVALETGLLRWSTLGQRVFALTVFDAFLSDRGISEPRLDTDPGRVRHLMLDFLGHVTASRSTRGPTAGQPVSAAHAKTILVNVEQFYLFMHDNRDEAAAAAGDPGWRELGAEHAGFYRARELPRPGRRDPALDIIDDVAMTQIMAGIGMLGDSAADGGLDDPQAMRIMMLQARLGRRISEILMLDADPLLPLVPGPRAAAGPGALTARLRYQQTKIDGPRTPSRSTTRSPRSSGRSRNGPPPGWRSTPPRDRGPATCSSGCCSTATPTGPTCRRPFTRRSPSWPAGSASVTAPAARSTSSGRTASGIPGPPACSTPASRFTSSSVTWAISRPP